MSAGIALSPRNYPSWAVIRGRGDIRRRTRDFAGLMRERVIAGGDLSSQIAAHKLKTLGLLHTGTQRNSMDVTFLWLYRAGCHIHWQPGIPWARSVSGLSRYERRMSSLRNSARNCMNRFPRKRPVMPRRVR